MSLSVKKHMSNFHWLFDCGSIEKMIGKRQSHFDKTAWTMTSSREPSLKAVLNLWRLLRLPWRVTVEPTKLPAQPWNVGLTNTVGSKKNINSRKIFRKGWTRLRLKIWNILNNRCLIEIHAEWRQLSYPWLTDNALYNRHELMTREMVVICLIDTAMLVLSIFLSGRMMVILNGLRLVFQTSLPRRKLPGANHFFSWSRTYVAVTRTSSWILLLQGKISTLRIVTDDGADKELTSIKYLRKYRLNVPITDTGHVMPMWIS